MLLPQDRFIILSLSWLAVPHVSCQEGIFGSTALRYPSGTANLSHTCRSRHLYTTFLLKFLDVIVRLCHLPSTRHCQEVRALVVWVTEWAYQVVVVPRHLNILTYTSDIGRTLYLCFMLEHSNDQDLLPLICNWTCSTVLPCCHVDDGTWPLPFFEKATLPILSPGRGSVHLLRWYLHPLSS